MSQTEYFEHHGILGMHWGIRRDEDELSRLERKDTRWANRKSDKITRKARRKSERELSRYADELLRDPQSVTKNGKLSAKAVNLYNNRMAALMSEKVSNLKAPSGRCVKFVAKRGEIGVFMALADENYNMGQLKNGIWDSGKVAYRSKVIDKIETGGT